MQNRGSPRHYSSRLNIVLVNLFVVVVKFCSSLFSRTCRGVAYHYMKKKVEDKNSGTKRNQDFFFVVLNFEC
jgi:hypothetical protein